jgi:acetyl-CoA acyltransferase
MREVVIVDVVRTAIGKRNGALSGIRPDELLGSLLDHLVNERVGIDPELIEDFICGCVTQVGEQAMDIGRNAVLVGGLPISIPGVTLNRHCGSSQQAIVFAANVIAAGDMDIVLAGGVESMSRTPMGSDGMGDHIAHLGFGIGPKLFERFGGIVPQGMSAELIAEKWGLSRREVDEFGKRSNELAIAALDAGLYDKEIMPVEATDAEGNTFTFKRDEGPRREVDLEKMAALKTPFKQDGVVTAGNSSQISDGASAALLMTMDKCKELGLTARARYVCTALTGEDPILMLTGPISATPKVLAKAGLTMKDIDVFEINEAFASVVLAWVKELDPPDMDKVNPWGGAIANGHPLGASGGKLTATLLSELEHFDGRYGLQSMCMGMGMGIATIYEKI